MSLLNSNLKAFLAIVRQGTVHGAAKDLHLTQTAVTQRIRAIERDLGTTLFLRSRKGMTLTPEGSVLLRYCKGAEELEGEVFSQIRGAGADRPVDVTLVGPTSIMTSRIPDLCSDLYHKWPNLNLNFVIDDCPRRITHLRSGKATLVIIPDSEVPNEMDSKRLKAEKYILVATSKWRGRKLNEILEKERVIDFYNEDQTSLNYLKKFDLETKLKRLRLFVNNNEALIKFLVSGVGFGTLTQEIAKPYLDSGKLITLNYGSVLEDSLALVWYPRPEVPAYFKSIVDTIK